MGRGNLRQYLFSAICQLSVMVVGVAYSWFEPITMRLAEDPKLNLTREKVSWIIASLEVGNAISPVISGELTNRVGRKLVILCIAPLCLVGWILILYSKSMLSLIAARVFHGLAVGIVFTVAPIYTAEVAGRKQRGRISGTFEVAWYLGNMYSFCVGPFLNYDMFAYACLPLPILFTILGLFLPETPYYLLMIKRDMKAKEVLKYFRDGDVEEELQDMKNAMIEEMSTETSWKTLFCNKFERKAFIIVQIVSITKYLSGMSVIENYALEIFSRSEVFLSAENMSTLLAALLAVISLIGAMLTDWVGRKPLLLISCFGSFLAHFLSGGYYFILEKTSIDASNYTWALYTGLCIYCILSSIGLGLILRIMQSEMFGAKTRGIAAGITEGFSSLITFVIIKLFNTINEAYGLYANFWFYSIASLIGGILLSFLAYETAEKMIGRMEERKKKSNV